MACQDARKAGSQGTGFSPIAGQKLNLILNELCVIYDLEVNTKPGTVVLTGIPTGPPGFVGVMPGVGPYPLPADYLRMAQDEVIYSFDNTPQKMVSDDLSVLDFLSLEPVTTNFPTRFATDINTSPPSIYVWPPPQGAITVNFRYSTLEADISTPETSASQPWMKLQTYLICRLTAELTKPDPRWKDFAAEAEALLGKYLESTDDNLGRAMTIKLDERNFSGAGAYYKLRATKNNPF
jgi:hypothetical protein